MPRTYKIYYLLLLAIIFGVNVVVTKGLVRDHNPENSQADKDKVVSNPLYAYAESLSDPGRLAIAEKCVVQVPGTKSAYGNLYNVIADILNAEEKLDVLFVGDSTISYGFSYEQFAKSSGLVTGCIAFGLNVPDEYLAGAVKKIAQCAMKKDGVIILSFGWHVFSKKERLNREKDNLIKLIADDRISTCEEIAGIVTARWRDFNAFKKKYTIWNILLSVDRYNAGVRRPLKDFLERHSFLHPLHLNVAQLAPQLDDMRYRKKTPALQRLVFLQWDPAFKVLFNKGDLKKDHWHYSEFIKKQALEDFNGYAADNPGRVSQYQENMTYWCPEYIGRKVYEALPITVKNEDYRYILWKKYSKTDALLNYKQILKSVSNITGLQMSGNHHFKSMSGLYMARALGLFFKEIKAGNLPCDGKKLYFGTL